jgi:serine/threonine protein kinase
MGVTYLAIDKVLRRKVALKVIEVPATMRKLDELHQRFLREARSAASLRHPNVAAIYQFGASPDGRHRYYAMELVEGETLETRVRRDGPLNTKLVLEIAMQITRALMAAAAHGLIHRDLKPGNIMLAPSDSAELEVKVIDFGLAKAISDAENEMDLTHGGFVGTPNFASPEQFESRPVDVRSDIYSLGGTLWFALTGRTPFPGRNVEEIHRAQQSTTTLLHTSRRRTPRARRSRSRRDRDSWRLSLFRFSFAAQPKRAFESDATGEKHRRVAARKSERRQRERIFCQRHSGANSDGAGQDRGLKSNLAHFYATVSKQASQSLRNREAALGGEHS